MKEQMDAMMKAILSQEAKDRLGTIELVKPEKALQLQQLLL